MKHKSLWCYFNIHNPIVAWEVAIGRISSINMSPNIKSEYGNSFLSLWQYSRLKIFHDQRNISPFINEIKIENVRQSHFQHGISRLKGCYFFESKDMALDVVRSFGWNGLGFKEELLSEVHFMYEDDSDISHYDSAWITSEMTNEDIHSYLSGETKYMKPATELICRGRGVILNQSLINKATDLVKQKFPKASIVLDSAKLIFDDRFLNRFNTTQELDFNAFHAAQASPYFYFKNKDELKVSIIMCEKGFKEYGMLRGVGESAVPDLREYMFSFYIDENAI